MNRLSSINLNLIKMSLLKQIRQYRIDLITVIRLEIAIAISTYFGTSQIPDPIFTDFYAQDIWFGSDIPTIFGNITSLNSDFGRNNNVTANLWNYGTPHQQVEAQMKLRPSDPWLRNEGQVILAATGSSVESKAFHEPGGSFSPQLGSFGVSIWVVDSQGNLKATSDSIPLSEVQQRLLNTANSKIPGIATKTPYYQSSWNASRPGSWKLNLERTPQTDTKSVVVLRSVGPAGGTIDSLDWNGQRLLLNNRWIVKNLPDQVKVYLGSERSPHWTRQKSTDTQWQEERGWGYAQFQSPNCSFEDGVGGQPDPSRRSH